MQMIEIIHNTVADNHHTILSSIYDIISIFEQGNNIIILYGVERVYTI